MMRVLLLPLLLMVSSEVWAEACVVHSQAERLAVKLCQQNRSIPPQLFREGFCQPQLKGQQVVVDFVENCPMGAYGICRDAKVANTPYRQDIHYYGVDSDARYLKPYCENQNRGVWIKR